MPFRPENSNAANVSEKILIRSKCRLLEHAILKHAYLRACTSLAWRQKQQYYRDVRSTSKIADDLDTCDVTMTLGNLFVTIVIVVSRNLVQFVSSRSLRLA
ncbi:jg19533 [Pararge aegeria aegeria]|uniref:Jg19533 protein n=1 Tax=Pararge aegeria aegeria TaxID=348720 RepID=A0A8S4R3R7_9NEOP|nr:jg19533 [Pararge aegeria aegeria]